MVLVHGEVPASFQEPRTMDPSLSRQQFGRYVIRARLGRQTGSQRSITGAWFDEQLGRVVR